MQTEEFRKLVQQYQQSLLVVAFNYCRSRSDAEDVVQDVFLKLYRKPPHLDDPKALHFWLIRMTINRSKDLLRSAWRRKSVPLDDAASALSAPSTERNRAVFDAVMSLEQKYREVVLLYYYEDYSIAEIADLLSRKETTVQTQLMRARRQLKTLLQEVSL